MVSGVGHGRGVALILGQDEEPLTAMRRADFSRRKESCRHAVAQAFQVSGDFLKSKVEMAADVLKEAVRGLNVGHDAGHIRPQVAGVGRSELLAGDGERLARIAAVYEVNQSAPSGPIKGFKIRPDGGTIQPSVSLTP
jgi:hypothetical protein